jgi:hypothetical protein
MARVEDFHRMRTLDTLDASARFESGEGLTDTACWSFAGGVHTIKMNTLMPGYIDKPDVVALKRPKRKELQFLKSVHAHEVAHGIYTSRDFKGMNDRCKDLKIPFRYLNLFEDARIEALFRGRRPTSKTGTKDLSYDGRQVVSNSYGVRKFEWAQWQEFRVDTPESVFLSLIKAEGTKKAGSRNYMQELKDMFNDSFATATKWVSPDERIHVPNVGFLAPETTLEFWFFERIWRAVAGRGSSTRFPTTESLIPLIQAWCKIFPGERDFDQVGPGNDLIATTLGEIGECFNPSPKTGEAEAPSVGGGGLESSACDMRDGRSTGSDEKHGSADESVIETKNCILDYKTLNKLGLSKQYFDYV